MKMPCTACANVGIRLLADAPATATSRSSWNLGHSGETRATSAPGTGLSVIPIPDLFLTQSATSRPVLLGAYFKVGVFFLSSYSCSRTFSGDGGAF